MTGLTDHNPSGAEIEVDSSYTGTTPNDQVDEKPNTAHGSEHTLAQSQLKPPTLNEKDTSAASTYTDASFDKRYETDGSIELSKHKTAISERDEGIDLHKSKTAATIASIQNKLPHSFKLVAIVIALALSIFLVSLDMTIVATAIPEITDEFHSLQDLGWYGSAFFLTVASFQSTWGKVYRYFPLKSSFLVSIFIFELGSLICAVAQNSVTLIVGRAIAGVGGAGIASGSYTLMAFAAPPERRAAFTGIMGAAYGVASVVGPILGGVFTEKTTWRWCFYVNLPIGGFSAALIFLTFQAPEAAKPQEASNKEKLLQMDFPGTFVLMAAVVCFLLAIQWGGVSKAWNDSQVVGLLVGFCLLILVFAAIQYFSGERALLQGRLLKKRSVLMASLFTFFFAGSFFLLIYQLPLYFQSVLGVSPADSGVRNIPLLVGGSIFSILSGGIIAATGYYQPFLLGGSALVAVGSGLIYTMDANTGTGQWIGYQILAGVGVGFAIQTAVIVGQASVENEDISTVTAMILFFQTIGGAFFVQAGQSAFSNELLKSLPFTAPGVNPALVLATGASALRTTFKAEQLSGIIEAYILGQRDTYILSIALSGVAFIIALFSEWKSIKGKAAGGGAV
jgi:MFS transporter, DHA2 family, glioxin efflux transporter